MVGNARAQNGGRAYAVTGCGKKMTVECIYSDNNPDAPYECTSRNESEIAASPTAPKSTSSPLASASIASGTPTPPPAPATIAPATMIAPTTAVGSGARYIATDGHAFSFGDRDSKTAAIAASGAFDLGCAPAGVTGRILYTADFGKPLYVAEGCGQRAIYAFVRKGTEEPEVDVVVLTSVVSVKSQSPSP